MTLQTFHIPIDVPLPPCKMLTAGTLKCMYEKGNLRYIYSGEIEVIRMIYNAVRDENWETSSYDITDEVIEEREGSFLIKYTACYQYNQIHYKAFFEIEGKDDTISFLMKGVALNRFLTNRIGVCVHHAIRDCAGKKVVIKQPDANSYESSFPVDISPHQPFKQVQQMQWPIKDGVDVILSFEGDVFETEDQRNWTDASYKTYPRPLELPFPFWVSKGETTEQKIILKVITIKGISNPSSLIASSKEEIKIPFPKIGYCRSKVLRHFTENELDLLKKIPFDHYRVEIRMDEANWQKELAKAFSEARELATKLELVIFFSPKVENELQVLIQHVQREHDFISSILVLQKKYQVTPNELLDHIYPSIKNVFPLLEIGYGTTAHFAELNRNRPKVSSFDFVSYGINPQVHAFDTRSLIENLEAQSDTIKTTQTFVGKKAIHIAPVTFKKQGNPDTTNTLQKVLNTATDADARQHTWFAAHWTLQTIKNLSEANSITLYEAIGNNGIIKEATLSSETQTSDEAMLTPIYKVLAAIKKFQAKWIIKQNDNGKTSRNGLLLENNEGDRLQFITDENLFSELLYNCMNNNLAPAFKQ